MKKIILATLLLSMSLFADFKTIDNAEFKKLQKEGMLVIDIRTEGEWKETGIIEGSRKMTFFSERGQPLFADWFFELGQTIKDKSEPFIIYCAHASRTSELGRFLTQEGFENVYELKGGIEAGWIKAGEKVVKE
jgi:rhodanese-related sulfurtransferase